MERTMTERIKYDDKGLVPAIAQDYESREVLMMAWMNKEAVEITLREKRACYYSRSRQKLWRKGETTGHIQLLKSFSYDCDGDTVLIQVEQTGPACHTGAKTCFFNKIFDGEKTCRYIADELYDCVLNRYRNPKSGSYTSYLFKEGTDKILKKVGEEASEVIIAAKNKSKEELIYEISDLCYHLTVLMVSEGLKIGDITKELAVRRFTVHSET